MLRLSQRPGFGRRYLFAFLAAGALTVIKLAIASATGLDEAFLLYFLAVVISAWYGGLGPAIFCTVICGFAGNYFFKAPEPANSSNLQSLSRTGIFVLEALFIGVISRSRMRAKRTAAEQNHLLEMMLSSVGDCVLTTNIRGQIDNLNPAAQALTGWTQTEAHGRVCGSVARFTTPIHPVSEALESGLPFRSLKPLELLRRNGSTAYVEVAVTPLAELDGTVTGSMVILRDRTAQIAGQRDLEEALARTTEILESISNAFYHLDSDWRFIYVNREAERLLQRTRGSLLGKIIWDEFDPKATALFQKEYTRAVSERSASRFEEYFYPLAIWVQVDAFPSPNGLSVYFSDITLRKRLEAERLLLFEQVSEDRHRLEAILNNLPAGVLIVDAEGKLALANKKVERLLGIPATYVLSDYEFSGYSAFHHQSGQDLRFDEYPVIRSLRKGITVLNEEIWLHGEAGDRLLEVSSSPVRESSGQITAAVGIFQDVTERHRTQNALVEARAETVRILESINEGFIAFDGTLVYRYLNPAAERMLDLSASKAMGEQGTEIFQLQENLSWTALLREVIGGGITKHVELFYEPWARWFESNLYPTRDGGVIALFTDVTNARETRHALLRSEHRYRSLVMATSQIVWSTSPSGSFDEPQASWAEFTGQQWPEYLKGGSGDMIHPEDRARVREEWPAGVESGKPFEVEYRLWHAASGEYHSCLSRGVPLRDGSGKVQEWVGTITDIHGRKRLEEKLLHTAKLESLGVLAGGIAHDFNNLLTGILGGASFLLDEMAADNSLRPLVQTLYQASERAAQLTRQMLAYSGRGRFVLEIVDISEEVKLIGELLRAAIPRNVELVWNLESAPIWAQVDLSQLQQLVMNLVINGAEAIDVTHGFVTVHTRRQKIAQALETLIGDLPAGEYAVVEIKDNGIGMDDHTRRRIFDPFFTTKFTGRGLGLAAALGIVQAHHGGLELETAVGRGTLFRVYLPASSSAPDAMRNNSHSEAKRLSKSVHKEGALLVVDDESVVIETAVSLLDPYGWRILTARNGVEALEVFASRQDEILLVLLDVAMPVMGGAETAKHLRERRNDLPIVVMSGFDEQETLGQFTDQVDGFLQKPFSFADLQSVLALAMKSPDGNG